MMDATSAVGWSESKLFHIMCPAAVGALPLMVMITTREIEKTIEFGLNLMLKVLPSYAFYHRGPLVGPSIGEDSIMVVVVVLIVVVVVVVVEVVVVVVVVVVVGGTSLGIFP